MKKVTALGCSRSEAASSSTDRSDRFNTVTMSEILQDDTTHRRLLEIGLELMLQQHLDGLQWISHHQRADEVEEHHHECPGRDIL